MVNEVERILHEIRDRVRAEEEQRVGSAAFAGTPEARIANSLVASTAEPRGEDAEALARVSAHLTTTARAWDRLPPVFSNRRGAAARLELWIKVRLKSLSRWFTWEQVNFNSAVHHALSDTLQALSVNTQELARLRMEMDKESNAWREQDREIRGDLEAQAANQKAQFVALEREVRKISEIISRMTELATEMNVRLAESKTETNTRLSQLASEMTAQLSQLAAEVRAEQRVCFKQLSLEASEATVREDRGRRSIQARLEKLEALTNGEE